MMHNSSIVDEFWIPNASYFDKINIFVYLLDVFQYSIDILFLADIDIFCPCLATKLSGQCGWIYWNYLILVVYCSVYEVLYFMDKNFEFLPSFISNAVLADVSSTVFSRDF